MIRKEIRSIAQAVGTTREEHLEKKALQIAESFLSVNELIDPTTLARASFYVAFREARRHSAKEVNQIINNNGEANRWWLYLVPELNEHLKTSL